MILSYEQLDTSKNIFDCNFCFKFTFAKKKSSTLHTFTFEIVLCRSASMSQ